MPPITNIDLQQPRVVSRAYRNRRIGDFLKELDLTEGKSTGLPIVRDVMAANGNPQPVFYTDEGLVFFMVTLPCHPELIVTKVVPKTVPKSGAKLSIEDINAFFVEGFDFEILSKVRDNDITEVRDYVVTKSVAKSGTKLIALIDSLSIGAKSRSTLLEGIGLYNKNRQF